uniref:Uncharacterized protein n=1 Tax=Kwoniella bestiolae CBS 10118 TaxID=1296100 RepID=A0A1B9G1A7_9TREE|nr:hypothetical protein I302_06260 [Kwoniella bestiolae CBS 10118]OCF24799.1 hypothetical protein I302_06260 [Kwoniella bestiolae CBS 10118]
MTKGLTRMVASYADLGTNGTVSSEESTSGATPASNAESNDSTPWWRDPSLIGGDAELRYRTSFKVANSERTIELPQYGTFFPVADTEIYHTDGYSYLIQGKTRLYNTTSFSHVKSGRTVGLPYKCEITPATDTLITHFDGSQYFLRDLTPSPWWQDSDVIYSEQGVTRLKHDTLFDLVDSPEDAEYIPMPRGAILDPQGNTIEHTDGSTYLLPNLDPVKIRALGQMEWELRP